MNNTAVTILLLALGIARPNEVSKFGEPLT